MPTNSKEYMREYMRRRAGKREVCALCGKEYALSSRYKHVKTRFHMEAEAKPVHEPVVKVIGKRRVKRGRARRSPLPAPLVLPPLPYGRS